MKPKCSEISLKNFQREASCVKHDAQDQKQKTRNISPPTRYVCFPQRDTLHASRFTFVLPRFTSAGFTLIEMLGVLAVLAILGGLLAPQVVKHLDLMVEDEEVMYLQNIAQGLELYVRENRSWPPNLAALSPNYVPISSVQIAQNKRRFPRYFILHPDLGGFSNATGIAGAALADIRFLLISNVTADANPTVTTGAQFDAWWNTDTTSTPNMKIYRGQMNQLFHLVSISAMGDGGSYRIEGTATSSGGGRLPSRGTYHLVGTPIEFDEADTFSVGGIDLDFILTSDAGYQFDPDCPAGAKWNALGTTCTT